jgi:SRSO17 transposase
VEFATKPELALEMITGAVAGKVPAAWVASDEVYGDNGAFRAGVAKLGLGYVLAVSCTHRIPAFPGGKRRLRADHIAAALPARCWHRVSAGPGSKGPRWYDWAWASAHQDGHSLLIRRGSDGTLAFYRCWSPAPVPLATLVHVAGMRWSVEVGHLWHRSSCAAFSWLRSLLAVGFLFGRCPAGASVEARGAGSALA